MRQIVRIGLEIAKRWFQLHASTKRKKSSSIGSSPATKFWAFSARCRLAKSLSKLFVVALLGSRDRTAGPSRAIDLAELRQALSQTRQVRRHDARAICETASRPDMRFIRVKTEEQQAALMQHTSRQLLIDQRNAVANSLRSQVAEFGVIEKRGVENLADLARRLDEDDPDIADIPQSALAVMRILADQLRAVEAHLALIDEQIEAWWQSSASA
jgi:transposase